MNSRTSSALIALSLIAGAASAQSSQAFQWKVSEGGNGHWYEFVPAAVSWGGADALCRARGGHLFVPSTVPECDFSLRWVSERRVSRMWVGYKHGPYPQGWSSVTGEPFAGLYGSYSYSLGNAEFLPYMAFTNIGTTQVVGINFGTDEVMPYLIEWDADCNGDGIVDYGQILSGDLADADSNGVPDCCSSGNCQSSIPTNLVLNGGFESGTPIAACSSEQAAAGSVLCQGWSVNSGVVSRLRGGVSCRTAGWAILGDCCVDLCGSPAAPGSIRQSIPTVAGRSYRCSFWISGDCRSGSGTKRVRVSIGNWLNIPIEYQCNGSGWQGWMRAEFTFLSRADGEILEFAATDETTEFGPLLDGIRVEDITAGCVGDVDGSGSVDAGDIGLLLLNFGECSN